MILIFHGLSFLVRYLLGERKRRKAIKEYEKIQQIINEIDFAKSCAYINAEQNLAFDPPVYRQRYGIIHDILLNAKWRKDLKKVVEFGCAEFGLLIFLKSLLGITEINFVDIDEELLQENLYRVRPFTLEYLKRRSEPLTVNVWAGSITDPDKRILDCDVVIGIEIIEHLYPDVLEAVPYTIFNCIQPKLAIFTTPNADFNVLFPKFKGFRHYDHKFEWTREQFESWATNITDRFPQYFANFHGIGQGPEGTESLGCCSQMVVFIRKDVVNPSYVLPIVRCFCRGDMESNDKSQDSSKISNYCPSCCPPMISYGICTYFSYAKHFEALKTVSANTTDRGNLIFYKLLKTEEYPYTKDDRTSEQKIMDEIRCKITNLGYCYGNFFKEEKLRSEIPLNKLTCILDGQFVTIEEVQDILSRHGYKLEECFINEEDDEKRLCVIYEPEMENLSSSGKVSKKTFKMDDKKRLKALNDSGLVKTIPKAGSQHTTRLTTDKVFESGTSMRQSLMRKQIKAAIQSDSKFEPLFNKESMSKEPNKPVSRPMPDPNKVNELDCLNNRNHSRRFPMTKTFFSQLMRTQFKFSDRKIARKNVKGKILSPTKGQSNSTRKKKKSLSDSEDDVFKDIKSITNCLLENTLNKLDIKESSKLIVDHIDDPVVETPQTSSRTISSANLETVNAPLPSTSSNQEKNTIKEIEMDTHKVSTDKDGYTSGSDSSISLRDKAENKPGKVGLDATGCSTEALFDPNSQVDLLEDFDMPPLLHELESVRNISSGATPNTVVLIGVNLLNDSESVFLDNENNHSPT
ncbi:hypothetical protein WA026_003660 [Henosepilachna vigintioctopunctata]|uniref:Small RNA 2'-O-methyltransferase n=1 Tax=Henosepilachna vigintioctopunctata TaxID=420089 RepID=A0AAW1UFA3_9CUCU